MTNPKKAPTLNHQLYKKVVTSQAEMFDMLFNALHIDNTKLPLDDVLVTH